MSSTKLDPTQIDFPGAPTDLLAGDGVTAVTVGTGLALAGGTLTATGGGGTVTSVTASGPLASSGGTTPNISLTGIVPAVNQASQSMGGDVTGTTAAATVVKIQNQSIAAGVSSGQIHQYDGASWALKTALNGTSAQIEAADGSNITVGTGLVLSSVVLEATGTGGGITANQHKSLRQLIHLANQGPYEGFASGAYQETLPAGAIFPTSWIWWESAAKIKKIVEETVTYNGNNTINTDQWKVYDTDGVTVLATVTDSIVYSGILEVSRTRTVV